MAVLAFLPYTSACYVTINFASLHRRQCEVVTPVLFEAARSGDFSPVILEEGDTMNVKVSSVCTCVRVCVRRIPTF